jgi:hypothetical protein
MSLTPCLSGQGPRLYFSFHPGLLSTWQSGTLGVSPFRFNHVVSAPYYSHIAFHTVSENHGILLQYLRYANFFLARHISCYS